MRILALDSSSNVASVALIDDGVLIGEYSINHKKTHSQTLLPMVDTLLQAVEAEPDSIDLFAVSAGPGSFTGLRIGIATAKGLAHACDKPVVGVSTLEALAYNIPFSNGLIVPMLDARRDQVYAAAYFWENGSLQTHIAPCAVSVETLLADLKKTEKRVVFLGDGVLRFREQVRAALGEAAGFAPGNALLQRASSVAVAAYVHYKNGEAVSCHQLQPVYLRKSQAEREYEEKQKEQNREE